MTRVIHGTFVLELRGTRLLVDPWFHSGYLTRHAEPLGLTPARLPALAALLLTSDAPDHFDERALRDLAEKVPRAVAPAALRARLLRLGFRDVTALGWWESATIDGVTVTAVPTSTGTAANGYVVASDTARIWVAGTTSVFPQLAEVARVLGPFDVALLPVGGPPEMTPAQAAGAAATVDAARVVPSAYGQRGGPFAGDPAEAVAQTRTAMAAEGLADRLVVLEPGESWHYAKP
jgi:L-ascorbate metabolism protein UlaG (beta-lactamase superfamily)